MLIYNHLLCDKQDNKPSKTPTAYKLEYEWLAEVDSLALCNAQMNLKKAFEKHKKWQHIGEAISLGRGYFTV